MAGLSDSRVGAILRAEDFDRAKRFYVDVLGLTMRDAPGPTREAVFEAGDGTAFSVYERPGMPAPQNTTLGFVVADVDATVADLRARGVVFEEYDMPEIGLKTVGGIAEYDGAKIAFFKDSEDNILSLMNG